ncbi:terpene synthase family protein [Lentzea sp. NPDC006480]|uniref:terpene synthase family protein n=1 Tax=Lentzea sp. NPDC006480 TaxID=3157176 RepID=UPI0033BAFE3F
MLRMEMPVLDRSYPVRQSPHYRAVKNSFHRWMGMHGPYRTAAEQDSFAAKEYVYLASIAFPACDERTLQEFAGICATMTERDDDWADHWNPLIAEIWTGLASHTDPRQMSRLTEAVSAYREGCVEHEQKLIQGDILQDVESYLISRRRTVGQLIDHVLVEISLGIDIGDSLTDPLMSELVRCDVERVIACQDVLSFPKELRDGDQENLVAVIAAETGCTYEDAITQACVFFKDANARTDKAADAVLASELGKRRDVRQFVRGLNDFVAGLIEWTSCSSRYTGRPASTWTTPTVEYRPED